MLLVCLLLEYYFLEKKGFCLARLVFTALRMMPGLFKVHCVCGLNE